MKILALDPGNTQTGVVVFEEGKGIVPAILPNDDVLDVIADSDADMLAVEMIASYGMPVGAEVFDTCVWIGRYVQHWRNIGLRRYVPMLVFRKDVKLHLCGSPRAKDGNIRQALIDRFGPPGTSKQRGLLYGVKSHAWAALAVACYASDTLKSSST